MTPEQIAFIIGLFTLGFSIWGMQCKSMKYIIISQIIANLCLGVQLVIEGAYAPAINTLPALVLTFISYAFGAKNKDIPRWMVLLFVAIFTIVTIFAFVDAFDLLTMVATWFFAIAITRKKSYQARVCSLTNLTFYLIYDIFRAQSAILTHVILILFIIVGIIRLDISDWKAVFSAVFSKKEVTAEKKLERTEKKQKDT